MSPNLFPETGAGCDNETAIIVVLKDIQGQAVVPKAPPRTLFCASPLDDTAPRFLQSSLHNDDDDAAAAAAAAAAGGGGGDNDRSGKDRAHGDEGLSEGDSGKAGPAATIAEEKHAGEQASKASNSPATRKDSSHCENARAQQRHNLPRPAISALVGAGSIRPGSAPSQAARKAPSVAMPSPFMVLDPIVQDPVETPSDREDGGDRGDGAAVVATANSANNRLLESQLAGGAHLDKRYMLDDAFPHDEFIKDVQDIIRCVLLLLLWLCLWLFVVTF